MKPGLQANSVPRHVFDVLADVRRGDALDINAITARVRTRRPELNGWAVYASAAQALTQFAREQKVQREKRRGRYVYWREPVAACTCEGKRTELRTNGDDVFLEPCSVCAP